MKRLKKEAAPALALCVACLGALAGAEPGPSPGDARESGPVKSWVFFKGKGLHGAAERDAALAGLRATADPRAIRRRELRRTAPALFDERDLPVAPAHLDALRGAAAEPVVVSRWLNATSTRLTAGQVRTIAALPFVDRIEPVRRGRRIAPDPGEGPGAGRIPVGADPYGVGHDQLAQINLIALHQQGFDGTGVIVGVLDTGFKRTHEAFNHPDHPIDVLAEWDFINGDGDAGFEAGDPVNQHNHGTYILGVLGAYMPGSLLGGAHGASFILAKTEDTTDEYPLEEDYYVAGLEFIEAGGADLATSSLGYIQWYDWFDMDGATAVTSIAVNVATANGLACCTAVGNGGRDSDFPTLIAPSDAFDVISCGAVDAAGVITGFSSAGPTADGRLKPEVLALGQDAASVTAQSDDGYVTTLDGTSLATPLVAAAVACIIQAHPAWTVAQIRENLFETAIDYVANGAPDPEGIRGYGIIDAFAAAQVRSCPGDADGDGAVGITDLLGLLAAWGSSDPAYDIAPGGGDGAVGIADLLALLAAWGPCA